MSLGAVSRVIAADTWEAWPKKTVEPGVDQKPAPPPATGQSGAATAGDAAGAKTSAGLSTGTIGWIAAGTVGVIAIAVAAGSSSNH